MAMDRNEHARRHAAAQSQHLQVVRALANGAAAPRDRFDNKIRVGSLILFKDLLWQVADVEAVPLGEGPIGAARVTVRCQMPLDMIVNTPNPNLCVVGFVDPSGQHSELRNDAAHGPAEGEGSRDVPLDPAGGTDATDAGDDPAKKIILTGDFGQNGGGDGGGSRE